MNKTESQVICKYPLSAPLIPPSELTHHLSSSSLKKYIVELSDEFCLTHLYDSSQHY